MLLTPTYHVFAMYLPYQDATELPLQLDTPKYTLDGISVPEVHGSAVRAKDGHVYVALTNLDPARAAQVQVKVQGLQAKGVSGTILTAPKITSRNTFDRPNAVKPAAFSGARVQGDLLKVALPAKSIVMLQLR
jgi:alpha-N-arabinofuranosidase